MELVEIFNDELKVKIKLAGAEILSVQEQTLDYEYMWQADPEVWGSTAPVLFPIVGRVRNFRYQFDGQEYEIPQHGIFRRNDACYVLNRGEDWVSIALDSSEETKLSYPFDFRFVVTFQLQKNKLVVKHTAENTGDRPMFCSIGGHPGFKIPHGIENYKIKFSEAETCDRYVVGQNGLIKSASISGLENSKEIQVTKNLFDNDALVFKNIKSKVVSIVDGGGRPAISMELGNFPYLGIWSKPGASFICIEPWQGIADSEDFNGSLDQKEGIVKVESRTHLTRSYRVTFH